MEMMKLGSWLHAKNLLEIKINGSPYQLLGILGLEQPLYYMVNTYMCLEDILEKVKEAELLSPIGKEIAAGNNCPTDCMKVSKDF